MGGLTRIVHKRDELKYAVRKRSEPVEGDNCHDCVNTND